MRVNQMLDRDMTNRAVNYQSKVESMLSKPRSEQRMLTEPNLSKIDINSVERMSQERAISPYRASESIKMLEKIVDLH